MKTFDDLIKGLQTQTFEEIANSKTFDGIDNSYNVECCENEVYEDMDLYDFLLSEYNSDIEDFGVGYAIVSCGEKKYELPYRLESNRFGDDLPDETILTFDHNRIYEIKED